MRRDEDWPPPVACKAPDVSTLTDGGMSSGVQKLFSSSIDVIWTPAVLTFFIHFIHRCNCGSETTPADRYVNTSSDTWLDTYGTHTRIHMEYVYLECGCKIHIRYMVGYI